jgi:hypothetical protein
VFHRGNSLFERHRRDVQAIELLGLAEAGCHAQHAFDHGKSIARQDDGRQGA